MLDAIASSGVLKMSERGGISSLGSMLSHAVAREGT